MNRICELTGKKTTFGNSRSKSLIPTRRTFKINLHYKKYVINNSNIKLRLSTNAIRTINKKGSLEKYLKENIGSNDSKTWSNKLRKIAQRA